MFNCKLALNENKEFEAQWVFSKVLLSFSCLELILPLGEKPVLNTTVLFKVLPFTMAGIKGRLSHFKGIMQFFW